jgi:hypothetical protein
LLKWNKEKVLCSGIILNFQSITPQGKVPNQ